MRHNRRRNGHQPGSRYRSSSKPSRPFGLEMTDSLTDRSRRAKTCTAPTLRLVNTIWSWCGLPTVATARLLQVLRCAAIAWVAEVNH